MAGFRLPTDHNFDHILILLWLFFSFSFYKFPVSLDIFNTILSFFLYYSAITIQGG
ncbi:hypothetical protein HMPREF0083_05084 [Aneurinibacillus aneurinilyticus ATCC 12856]|uniref:Uncharacterized protein n=1 Tax=Aneurinibacillus aneurinilyticus ATCC 12856 TaxID=649747 RepID=U1Y3V4_ANEAE|nr:hypothetical protein HMPREF0083_05084 [Aneurinibacillus aneurinilyticus ATCC 12856]